MTRGIHNNHNAINPGPWPLRPEGRALLSALVAVAATARRRYPKANDREAFEQFLTDSHTVRLGVEFRGECHQIEHIFYKWLRCEIAHEGGLPVDIDFVDDTDGYCSVRAGGVPEYVLKLGSGWFAHFVNSVVCAPENAGELEESGIQDPMATLIEEVHPHEW